LQALLQRFASKTAQESTDSGVALATPLAPATAVASAVSASAAQRSFDYARGLGSVDQEILEIIAQAFIDQWPHDLQKMQAALASGDLQSVLHTSHALKGTLAMFGAVPARDLASRIESLSAKGGAAEVGALLPPLVAEVECLLKAVAVLLQPTV
jgi:HPt (histidine-containing phosphotransfer) domain-containing protein